MHFYLWGALVFFVLLVGTFLLLRMQYGLRIQRSDFCPKCGGSKFHRIHRRTVDRLLGIGLGTRRFRCANPNCRWEGMREYYPSPRSWNKSRG